MRGRGYLLGKANEILVIGVDVGELDVNQQHDLNLKKKKESQKWNNEASLNDTKLQKCNMKQQLQLILDYVPYYANPLYQCFLTELCDPNLSVNPINLLSGELVFV